ncbi:MAG: hypothetical protein QM784_33220 [Polyangiaceae bacterium]
MNLRLERWLRQFQRHLERFYALERAPDVHQFLQEGDPDCREQVLVHEEPDAVAIALVLSPHQPPEGALEANDAWSQIVEGVSHFIMLSERARRELSTTQLELELQAEIDKFVLFAAFVEPSVPALVELHRRLYEDVRFLHDESSEEGHRYRLANRWAARFIHRLLREGPPRKWQERLRAFYRAGPTEKISLLNAA